MTLELLLLVLGVLSGMISGLLGIGGAIIIVPFLLYIPQWLGVAVIEVREAAAIAVTQVVAATLTGSIAHGRKGTLHFRLAVVMGITSAAGALASGILSAYVPNDWLLLLAAILATSAAGIMALPAALDSKILGALPRVNYVRAVPAALFIGMVIGAIGIGSFLYVPTLIFVLGLPTRVAVATVLAIAFPASLSALIGKVITNQVPLLPSLAIVAGAIPGAQIGSWLSVRTSPRILRLLYGTLIMIVAFGLWYDFFNAPTGSR